MKKAKKILSLLLVIALTATITLSATLAYLTDEDEAVNVMVMGNIDIEQREHDRNGEDFEQHQTLLPIVGNTTQKDSNGYPLPDNYMDKIVSVKNTGGNDAYVRTFIAIPEYTYEGKADNDASANVLHWNGYSEGDAAPTYPVATWLPAEQMGVDNHWSWGKDASAPVWPGNGGDWNMFQTTIEGQKYSVYVVTHTTKVAPGEITAPNMTGVYLDSMVDYDHNTGKYTINGQEIEGFNGTVEVLVATQAVQYDKGWGDAWTALNEAFYIPSENNHPWTDGVSGRPWDGNESDAAGLEENTDTDEKTVEITTAEQLKAFADEVNAGNSYKGYTIKLTDDINLADKEWTPIGNSTTSFQGTFDGNGHTIENLNVNMPGKSDVGLFGVTSNGEIKNLTIEDATIVGRLNVGVVAGTPYTSKYTNITVTGHVEVDGMSYVGGIGGKNAYANWTDITVDVDDTSYVMADSVENGIAYRTYVGGVVGFMGEGGHKFTNVTSNIDVTGSTCDVGGIVGIAHYGNSFINCSSSGDVAITAPTELRDAEEIGGIAGVWHNESGTTVTFTNCKFTGTLSADYNGENDTSDNTIVGKAYNTTGTGTLIIN